MKQDYAAAGVEPPLEEVLHDPVVELVMKRDGLEERDIRHVIAVARRWLLQRRAASGRHPGAAR